MRMKTLVFLTCTFALSVTCLIWAQDRQRTDDPQRQTQELAQKRQELFEKQIEILKQQIDLLKRQSPQSRSVLAMQSILDLKLSQERLKTALAGAKIIADDGTYLGTIGPTYNTESIFCSYGTYGAEYSTKSIWCTYGEYGASYNVLSPFCSYSTKPPKIIVDGTVVATLTVSWMGFPTSVSPNALKAIFADE
jgi:hypothetical protein